MKLLIRLLRKNWYLVLGTMLAVSISSGVNLVWNSYISRLIDGIVEKRGMAKEVLGMLGLCILLTMGLNYLTALLSGWTFEKMSHHLRMGFVRNLLHMKYEEIEKMSAGEQMSYLQNEIAEASSYLGDNLIQVLNMTAAFVITLIYLMIKSPVLTLASNLPVVLLLYYSDYSSRIISGLAQEAQELKMEMSGMAEKTAGVIPVVHLYDCKTFLMKNYTDVCQRWKEATVKEEKVKAGLMSLSALLSIIPLLILLSVGGYMVIRGTITIGVVYIFINLSKQVSGAIMNLPGIIAGYRRFLVNLRRMEGKVDV